MVKFVYGPEVEHWLNGIEPAQQRREVAAVLATRALLRVLPLLGQELTHRAQQRDRILSDVALPCFRAAALTWFLAKFPSRRVRLSSAADDSATYAYKAADTALSLRIAAFASAQVARAASSAADIAGDIGDFGAIAALAANTIATAPGAAEATNAIISSATAYADASADAEMIDSGGSAAELAGEPLWPDGAPGAVTDAWRTLKSATPRRNEGWEVLSEWYEARIDADAAHPPIEALEIARSTIPDEMWRRGPRVVNAEIKRLTDEHEKGA